MVLVLWNQLVAGAASTAVPSFYPPSHRELASLFGAVMVLFLPVVALNWDWIDGWRWLLVPSVMALGLAACVGVLWQARERGSRPPLHANGKTLVVLILAAVAHGGVVILAWLFLYAELSTGFRMWFPAFAYLVPGGWVLVWAAARSSSGRTFPVLVATVALVVLGLQGLGLLRVHGWRRSGACFGWYDG